MAQKTATYGEVTVGFSGSQYSFTTGGAQHCYHATGPHAKAHLQKFRYTLSQVMASQQKAQELIDKVGGPLARDPEQVEHEKDLLRAAGVRVD